MKYYDLKFNARTILPLILAAVLPGIGLYSAAYNTTVVELPILPRWIFGSAILLLAWYIYWYFIDFRAIAKKWKTILGTFILAALGLVVVQALAFNEPRAVQLLAFVRFTFASILIITFQYALKTQINNARLQLEKEQMQTENYRVQLKALSTKIDPHFLFNSLNTLRSMVRQQHKNSEEFIISMSDFYRQILKHNENATLPLSDELSVLNSYLFLMMNRNEGAVKVAVKIDEALYPYHLPTLALQSVIENCFKHNSMTSKKPLKIDVQSTQDGYIEVTNNIQPKLADKEPTGIGLDLIRKRYELLHVKDGVFINNTSEQFTTRLKLI